jgi:hypothetical protein
MNSILLLIVTLSAPMTVLAQGVHAPAPQKELSLVEVAARVRRVVEAHEETLATEKANGTKKTAAEPAHKFKTPHASARVPKITPHVGLVWRISLVWPPELREATDASSGSTPAGR